MAKTKTAQFRTLYFIRGPRPTEEQTADAETHRGTVVFRNANHIAADGALEDFDAVAGDVPARYREAAEAKALLGEGEPAPEPLAALPASPASPLKPVAPVAAPVPKPGAAKGWKPNA